MSVSFLSLNSIDAGSPNRNIYDLFEKYGDCYSGAGSDEHQGGDLGSGRGISTDVPIEDLLM